MNIYSDYVNLMSEALGLKEKTKLYSNYFEGTNFIEKAYVSSNLSPLKQYFPNTTSPKKLGEHPDFNYLKQYENKTEKHYIISLFVDVKGSTNFFKKYSVEQTDKIIKTIIITAIGIFSSCGGYIQRLQGDCLFIYFGGKNLSKEKAIEDALLASSIFLNVMSNDLQSLFERVNINGIKTRIGIDIGDDKDVLWTKVGLGDCSEVTTCSLHTSLAAKMESNASSNGIVVGQNIIDFNNNINRDLYKPVCIRTKDENDRYIFRNDSINLTYTQYDFDWKKYLSTHNIIYTTPNEEMNIKEINKIIPEKNIIPIASKNKPYLP